MSGFQPKRLFEVFEYQLQYYPQKNAISFWDGQQWAVRSTAQCLEDVRSLAWGIRKAGWPLGEKIGLLAQSGMYSWVVTDAAIQMAGCIPVPMHASSSVAQLAHIISDSQISRCFIGDDPSELLKASEAAGVSLETYSLRDGHGETHWTNLQAPPNQEELISLKEISDNIDPTSLATIIYTSGTTGNPKGVMLSHQNILSNILSTIVLIPVNANDRVLSYLPPSHIFERMVLYSYLMTGASIFFARSVNTILEDLQYIKPHYFTSVPRLLEKVYERIIQESSKGFALKRRLVKWAVRVGEQYQNKKGILHRIQRFIANILVYRVWRNRIGGHVKGVIVGAAALQPRLGRLFSAARIKIREGYGLTETSPVISFNRFEPGGNKFGTVGIPIPGIELRIASEDEHKEGEIQVRGPGVMLGYHNLPEKTKEVIDEEGWFSTGDTGRLINRRFLQISGRKKDIFKTTTGKYVAPLHVENTLKENIYISQCMVIGANMPYPGALIIPNFDHLQVWCEEQKVHWTAPQFMVINPRVVQLFKEILAKMNHPLSKEEKVRRFYLLHEEWSAHTLEYGPTLKLIRPFIRNKYQKQIEELFGPKGLEVPRSESQNNGSDQTF
ncbi:MAG: long-chain fatty acid--CoA ligase [Saprospiraceae bacterium]|nr:long-chain fatty acid--CoA ligase [Saprospiraceae bacterium]